MKLATEKSSFAFLCSMMTLPIYGAYHSSLQYLPNDFMFQNTLLTVLYVMIGLSCIYLIQALTNIFAFYYKKG